MMQYEVEKKIERNMIFLKDRPGIDNDYRKDRDVDMER